MTTLAARSAATPAPPVGPMTPTPMRVVDRRVEHLDTVTFSLAPVGGGLVAPEPGQFLMLWAPGVGEVPISVAGVRDDGTVEHTVRAVGAVTRALCDAAPGTVLGARGPFGRGWGLAGLAGRDLLLVAGGIGIAPLRPVVHHVLAEPSDGRRLTLLFGARDPQRLLYTAEIAGWIADGAADGRVDVRVTVDTAERDWPGTVGFVTQLIPRIDLAPDRTTALVCGPEPMMRFTARTLLDAGLGAGDIRVSLERSMTCGIGQCGHCQLGPALLCREGPVVDWTRADDLLAVRER